MEVKEITPGQKPTSALMKSAVARMSEEAQRIGFGFIRLPKQDVAGWIILLAGEDVQEGMYVRVIVKRGTLEDGTNG